MRKPSIVITYPFPLGQRAAGGSRTTPEIARQLAARDADVTLLVVKSNPLDRRFPRSPPPDELIGHHLDEELAEHGVRLVREPQNPFHYHLDGWSVRRGLARILAERPVDAVLSHYEEAAFLPSFLRRRSVTFGFFATWQTYSWLSKLPPGWRGVVRKAVDRRFVVAPHRRAEILFALSEFTKGELVEHMGVDPGRVVISPLGVHEGFSSVPRKRTERVTRLLYFGRLAVLKGFHDALDALGQLHRRGISDWTYRMFGTGRRDLVKKVAQEHGIADKVEVFEPVDDAGLQAELAKADLAIMPSHFESFGLSIAEAQAAGVPVVAYDVGSVPEVVENGVTGWLAPFRHPEVLADHIAEAMRDPEATFERGLRARERARRLFRWERTAEILLEALERHGSFQRGRLLAPV